jgi:hypothetical protein
MDNHKIIRYGAIFMVFLAGLNFYVNYSDKTKQKMIEGMTTNDGELRCPNILIQKGSKYYLYNSKIAQVPGVNPIMFNNLEEYTEFLEWQRGAGIRCPVLYVQNTYDVQGERVYKIRPSVSDLQGGLPSTIPQPPNPTKLIDAGRNDAPYNQGGYPAYDESSQYVGATTPLDEMDQHLLHNSGGISPDPMSPKWGGADYTESLVKSGYYKDNEVAIMIP